MEARGGGATLKTILCRSPHLHLECINYPGQFYFQLCAGFDAGHEKEMWQFHQYAIASKNKH